MRIPRLLAILFAICSLPAVLAWCFMTVVGGFFLLPVLGPRTLASSLPAAGFAGAVLMGWVSLAALGWTVRHFSAFISPTPRWVLAGYLCGALILGWLLAKSPLLVSPARGADPLLLYLAGPACLLMLAAWRLLRIRRFYASPVAAEQQNNASDHGGDGTLDTPSDHLANPCSSVPPASPR
ncbi:hypothetical protein CR152_13120 [Massilia violaceinigra]|uniref:Uncharacterized protein n=1 Tax=Massilia violaceinigra TaxID=2045208 RepID=A0A2D2DK50_9BURK|nr:hypothetical protein [Massilia violaceinigra]ATQ75351.1 hypothetical protein CR152_13120 [Massilia violaceinigra]